ncbi:MAG TPA: delta-60 repeat domain-containing protein, partial [Wenzhouxiangella sp.]|nr:delta-60 repeat domain-containing protein [Wenzhouxiangella sp.]
NDTARDLIVQPDGRILVAGEGKFPSHGYTTDFVVVRLEADGSLDAGFGTSGVASHSINTYDWTTAVALLAGGQIVVGGHSDKKYTFVRFTSNGSLDAGFGTGGVVQVDFAGELDVLQDLIVLDDWQGQGERIVAVGSARTGSSVTTEDFAAVMLTGNGALEPGFGSGGKMTFDFDGASDQAFSVTETTGGGLVLAGRFTSSNRYGFAALALSADGTPDSSFFQTGAGFTQNFTATSQDSVAAAIARDGNLNLVGTSFDQSGSGGLQKVALARLAASTRIFSDRFEQP